MSSSPSRSLFGTDGVRGTANIFPMTAEIALSLGQAVAYAFRRRKGNRILIGKDTRLSSYMFENALAAGICSMGANVIQVGPMPTPGLAFLTRDMRCDAGVMISASHNPYLDNGIKFFAHDGFKLPDEIEARMEALIQSDTLEQMRADPDDIGSAKRIEDAAGRYVVFLKKTFPDEFSLDGLSIVLDCANGAGYKVGPAVLTELGARVFATGVEPDGRNINRECGSLYPQKLVARVRELGADLGVALDGDADRCLIVSERGELVDGDSLLVLFARDLVTRGVLKGGAVVATVMSNFGLEKAFARLGIDLIRTQVGDRYVVERMRALGCNLGGEQSGHVIFLDHNTTGDGLVTALQALAIIRREDRPVSELIAGMERFPQVLINVEISKRRPLEELGSFCERVRQVENDLGDRGRVLVRYSGTEPKARVMVEGEDRVRVRAYAEDLAAELRRALGHGSAS